MILLVEYTGSKRKRRLRKSIGFSGQVEEKLVFPFMRWKGIASDTVGCEVNL